MESEADTAGAGGAGYLLGERPIADLAEYLAAGGGRGLRAALERPPAEVTEEVARSGLRGRGGAGFPTGRKWASVADAAAGEYPVFLVCNAAEGEPGTFKDRALLSSNPYQVVEGLLIAAHATGARQAFVGVKAAYASQRQRLETALAETADAGWPGAAAVTVVPGPDEYLFGEEKALLEVVEGKLPLPRILPPYMTGLYATMTSPNPTVVNNVETLAHVTHVLANGADWFRSRGSAASPGTMLFTVSGDVAAPGVYELPLGAPLRALVVDIAGAEDPKAVYGGTSNSVITAGGLDVPLDFDAFAEAGTGLGSGGFLVYGAHRDMVQVAAALARFLAVESCGQCPPCKLGTTKIFERLDALVQGQGTAADVEEVRQTCQWVMDGNRCYLPVGAALVVGSALEAFPAEFAARAAGHPSPPAVAVPVPKIVDIDADTGAVTYDADYTRKRADWSYAPAE